MTLKARERDVGGGLDGIRDGRDVVRAQHEGVDGESGVGGETDADGLGRPRGGALVPADAALREVR
ncbi:hypothetical protein GCM10009801_29290 [Streptomyces albiaxialis]|uniref:Uncharacterized protein n=1 Tax=Streptomyces albiaxialis TaxID=329523 RepID=A0ABN2VW63_9ACTN